MKSFTDFSESVVDSVAKRGFDKLVSAAGSVGGTHKGNVRVYYKHKGGSLSRTMVGAHAEKSFARPSRLSGSGHYFASHYSAKPGHDVYTHVKLPLSADLSNKEELLKHADTQNQHLAKGSGHTLSLVNDIIKYHGKD